MRHSAFIVAAALLAAAGCSQGARDVEYTPARAISADIDASRQIGPTPRTRGQMLRDEPYDALPWELDRGH
jgi:hypothetical protein